MDHGSRIFDRITGDGHGVAARQWKWLSRRHDGDTLHLHDTHHAKRRIKPNATQEEILWLCEAAHLPGIWATQVLEQLAKTGNPSRAEISDAAMSERAECVMLNQGPHINDAVAILDNILRRMADHHYKKVALMPSVHAWHPDVDADFRGSDGPWAGARGQTRPR